MGFLNNELKLIGIKDTIENICNVIDTLELSKQQRPGTMHNLDALCRRFGIDTSARTRHGALLDAQILAKVYLKMTGGQFEAFQEAIDTESNKSDPLLIKRLKENRDKMKVVYANKDELEAHENYFQN